MITTRLHTGWIAVTQRDVYIDYDLENSPLQIRTNSVEGSDEQVELHLYTAQKNYTADVFIYFTSPPQYLLGLCTSFRTNFPTTLPSEIEKVWTITLSRTSGERRVVIHCNNKEVINVVMSHTSCGYSEWSKYWREIKKIYFCSSGSASDYYRPGKYLGFLAKFMHIQHRR